MEVLVDGSRTNADYWAESQKIPAAAIPPVSLEEHRVAAALSQTDEQYARSKYAIEKTRVQLEQRAARFGEMVQSFLRDSELPGEVRQVWLSTFRGEYRIELMKDASEIRIVIPEDVADALLDGGSDAARRRLEALLVDHLAIRRAA